MKLVYFTHSLASCWNHGNAHFLRGLLREMVRRGHAVAAFEPAHGWSRCNLIADQGAEALRQSESCYGGVDLHVYDCQSAAEELVVDADVVIVHEWTDPQLVAELGRLRARSAKFVLLFHDTHHRAVSDPEAMGQFDLSAYDGILAFGASLADAHERLARGPRVFVFHEAADTHQFAPPIPATDDRRFGAVWIGNWGDEERSAEIVAYLLRPAKRCHVALDVYGVRYPPEAQRILVEHGASYRGWIANARVPSIFARHLMTVHVPRRFYTTVLPGIPTIRVFEALACGIPLISAPWEDCEGLFRPGEDYLVARTENEMCSLMREVANDADLRQSLVCHGLERIHARHTCSHRADELLAIIKQLQQQTVGVA